MCHGLNKIETIRLEIYLVAHHLSLGRYYLDCLTLPSFEVVEKMITDFRLFLVELSKQVQQDREAAVVLLHLTQVPEDQTHRLTHRLLQ